MPRADQGPVTIHVAAWRGDKILITKFVKEGEEMGYPALETLQKRDGVTGESPLHKAVENNQEAVVQASHCGCPAGGVTPKCATTVSIVNCA